MLFKLEGGCFKDDIRVPKLKWIHSAYKVQVRGKVDGYDLLELTAQIQIRMSWQTKK